MDKEQDNVNLVDPNLALRVFAYKDLSKATKSFSKSELLGSSGFGAVYKGTLPSGALVAVKRMRTESKHGKESFQAEVTSLSHIRHRNLVQLKGWCHKDEQLLLVYDYMCRGSLDQWLFKFPNRNGEGSLPHEALPLMLRHSILRGVAAALSYLHEECPQCVLHRDIKSSNILLDGEWNAYLGDFGLARVIDHHKMERTTMMAGTFGYMAPEMLRTGKATKESDVYSFGVLMLEVVCGRRPLEDLSAIERGDGILVDRVWQAHETGNFLQVADLRLRTFPPLEKSGSYRETESQEESQILVTGNDVSPDVELSTGDYATEDKKMVANLLHLGLLCCNPNPEDRPSIRLVSQLLQVSAVDMEMGLPPLSDSKPHACYSRRGLSEEASSIWSSSNGLGNVQEAAQGSSQSTPTPPSSIVSSHEPANNMLTSFAAPDSSVFLGR
jgi:serine/threonine protein kinase